MKTADTRKSSALLKSYLQNKYKVKFSVRTEKYSMGSSLRISYSCGPDSKLIETEVNNLSQGHFDGMEDIYNYSDSPDLIIDDHIIEKQKYVFVEQNIPSELWYKLAKFFSDNITFADVPKLENFEQLNDHFTEIFGSAWNWRQLIYQNFQIRNFCTDDFDNVKFINVKQDENNSFNYIFTYEYKGIKYNTGEYKAAGTKQIKKVNPGNVKIIDYSEKAIAIIGDTKPIKETLKKLGGRFNFHLSCGAGWIFPKTKQHEVEISLNL